MFKKLYTFLDAEESLETTSSLITLHTQVFILEKTLSNSSCGTYEDLFFAQAYINSWNGLYTLYIHAPFLSPLLLRLFVYICVKLLIFKAML